MPQSLYANPSFVTASWTMDILSVNTDSILSASSASIPALTTPAVTMSSYTNQSSSYSPTILYTSDVYFQTGDQTISLIENNSLNITPDLPCSFSGTTPISFSISSYNGATAPSWVAIDSTTGQLSITAPDVSSDTEFDFCISSNITGVPVFINKLMKLTIFNCVAQNCQTWSSTGVNNWAAWNLGYKLISGSWFSTSSATNTSSATSSASSSASRNAIISGVFIQALVLFYAFINILSLIINSSSFASFWSLINQLQLYFLLLLTKAFIPIDVQTVITGPQFVLNPFDYLNLKGSSTFYDKIKESFNFELSNSLLDPIGIKSDSTLFNMYSYILSHICIVFLHFVIYISYRLVCCLNSDRRWWLIAKWSAWGLSKALNFLTFGYYIRSLLEINQFLLISLTYEIYKFNASNFARIVSLSTAILWSITCFILIIFTNFIAFSSYQVDENEHNKLEEIVKGIKTDKKFKIYSPILLFRRAVFIVILITFTFASSKLIIGILSFLQLIYAVSIMIQRPFKEVKINLIEIINEIYFFGLMFSLFFLNTNNNWNSFKILLYVWVLASNSMIDCFIILGIS